VELHATCPFRTAKHTEKVLPTSDRKGRKGVAALLSFRGANWRAATVPVAIPNEDEGADLSLLETGETLKPSQNKIAIEKRACGELRERCRQPEVIQLVPGSP